MFKITTKKLVFIAIMTALGVVLKSFLSIGNGDFRISFWNIPLFIAGMVTGPLYGGLCALGADLIYGLCFSPFPFSIIMTISCVTWGLFGGLLYKKEVKIVPLVIMILINCLFETFINSLYLWTYYQNLATVFIKLPVRLIVQLIRCPISVILIYTINKTVLRPLSLKD